MKDRLPARGEIAQVYAVLIFVVEGWTFNRYSWQYSSWANFLDIDTLAGIGAYRIAAGFLESLLILAFLLFVCALFPPKLLKENFTSKGTIIVLVLFGFLSLFWKLFYARSPGLQMMDYAPLWLPCSLIVAFLVAYFLVRIKRFSAVVNWAADRMVIFLYILIPISIASLILILDRNIF